MSIKKELIPEEAKRVNPNGMTTALVNGVNWKVCDDCGTGYKKYLNPVMHENGSRTWECDSCKYDTKNTIYKIVGKEQLKLVVAKTEDILTDFIGDAIRAKFPNVPLIDDIIEFIDDQVDAQFEKNVEKLFDYFDRE